MSAIQACGRHGLGVVLVPTLVPGVNTHEIGTLVKKAMELVPTVRAIHFQPVSYFGRFPRPPADENRITLPRLMRAIEEQTKGIMKARDFKPPGCENALCSFHASYLILAGGKVRLLGGVCVVLLNPTEVGRRGSCQNHIQSCPAMVRARRTGPTGDSISAKRSASPRIFRADVPG